jgi:DNA-binding GntR family transcriptional regulator
MKAKRSNSESKGRGITPTVYEKLKRDIIYSRVGPGTRLLEVDLAESMGVSRTPVREALLRLEKERLIVPVEPRGYRVPELNNQHIEEIFGLREVLEMYAGGLATPRITNQDIRRLEAILNDSEKISEQGDRDTLSDLNTSFHETISNASGNSILQSFLEQINNDIMRYRALLVYHRSIFPNTIIEHRNILAGLKKRDSEAVRKAIGHHIRQTKDALLSVTASIFAGSKIR